MTILYALAAVLATLAAIYVSTYARPRARFLLRLALRRLWIVGALALAGCPLSEPQGTGGEMADGGTAGAGGGDAGSPDGEVSDGSPCPDGAPGSEAVLTAGGCIYYCPMPTPPWGTKYDGCTAHGANVYVCLPGYSACGADPQTDGCAHPLSSDFDCGACGVKCSAPMSCAGTVSTGFSCTNG